MEPEEVAKKYRNALRDLTFNSKPIINNLTMFAHGNIAHAPLIVKTLVSHLVTVRPLINECHLMALFYLSVGFTAT
jgi:hypothetical protein